MAWLNNENKIVGVQNKWIIVFALFIIMFTGVGAGIRRRVHLKSGQEYIDDVLSDIEGGDEWTGDSGKFALDSCTVELTIDQTDWQAGGSASPTSPVYTLYHGMPDEDSAGQDITVSGEDIVVKASENGIVWIDFYGGSDFYLVESSFRSANPEVKSVVITDFDGDGKDDFLAELDLSGYLKTKHEYKQDYTLALPLLDLDVTSWADDDPANVDSIGTSETVTTYTTQFSGLTAEDGAVISELYFVTNSSREGDDVTFEDLSLGGQWTLIGDDSFDAPVSKDSVGGYYAGWYIKAPDNNDPLEDEAVMVYRDTGKADTFDVTISIRCELEAGNKITVDLYLTLVSPDGSKTPLTDQVTLSA